jgi:ATP synthase subunit 8
MPQLDKYIFFNHVITLTIFFTLIYMYIRRNVVTNISLINKYRKNILFDKIFLHIKKLENPLKINNTLALNFEDVPYYQETYSLEDFKKFDPYIDEFFRKANLRWEFTFIVFSFISPLAIENLFKNYVKLLNTNLFNFINLTKNVLSLQVIKLFSNLIKPAHIKLNSLDLTENLDIEVIALKELIKN